MKSYLIKEIEPNSFFSKTVYLDGDFVIAAPEMALSKDITKILEKWSFNQIVSEGEPCKDYTSVAAEGESQENVVGLEADADKLEKAREFYSALLKFTDNLFLKARVSDELEYNMVSEKAREIVEYVKEDRRFIMRIIKTTEPAHDKNYLAAHSVRSTILAIIIGSFLKLPNHKLLELGIASLVHEAGMLKLPPQLYLSDKQLSESEKKAITSHPVLGYSMLKGFRFPLSICLACLEHHERENASGYPRKLPGEKIGLYSKIIAVACSYEALSSKRPHKEAKDGYTGMLELLKNEGRKYDDTIVKALVVSLSIYPIGLHVLLSNKKKGQVIDVNPENPRFPIVQIFGEITPDGKNKVAQTEPTGLHIIRPLNKSEIGN